MSVPRERGRPIAATAGLAMKHRAVLALGAGALVPCAFAPYGLWPLAMLGPAALLLLIGRLDARRAALLGWCWGLGLFGHGVWWIQVSVHQFGVPYYTFSVTVTALFIAGMAGYVAAYAYLMAKLPWPGGHLRQLLVAPCLWLLIEALRGSLFTGFPWLALGYSQIDAPLAGFAPLGGVPLCSLLVMLVAGALASLVTLDWPKRAGLVVLIIALLAVGARLRGTEWTQAVLPQRDVALVQGAVPQHLKWAEELRAVSLARYLELSAEAWDADVVIWPETAIPAFAAEIPDVVDDLQARAVASGTALLVGMPTGEAWRGQYYNSVVQFGAHPGRYDKRHLVPFGEFFPLKDLLGNLILLFNIPMSDFSAGEARQEPLQIAGLTASVSICYEDAFPQAVNDPPPVPDVLVNVSNDAWFGDTIAPHQHLEIARMRALESGRYMLRSTNTGISAVIDQHGRIVARAPQFQAMSLRVRFAAHRGSTPYARYGDWPVWSSALLVLVGALGRGWRRRAVAA